MNQVTVSPINSTATVPLQCYFFPPFCKTREMKKKKKKKRRRNADARRKFQLNPTGTLGSVWIELIVAENLKLKTEN